MPPKRSIIVVAGILVINLTLRSAHAERTAASIVARVDDQIILREEILDALKGQLAQAKKQLPEAQYQKYEDGILQQALNAKIQRVVVLKELESRLPEPAAMERIREQAAKDFEKYLLKRGREQKLFTIDEISAKLEEEGTSIARLREDYIDNLLATQYVGQLVRSQVKEPTRPEMQRYYRNNLDEFSETPGSIWRHIQVNFGFNQEDAKQKVIAVYRRLQGGEDFGDVAKDASNGPTAAAGGLWSKTSKGSYAETVVDEAIFKLPVGRVSNILTGKSAYHIVRVEERTDGTPKSFSEVQDIIKSKLKREQSNKLRQGKIDELMAKHFIETIFDDQPQQTADRPRVPPVR